VEKEGHGTIESLVHGCASAAVSRIDGNQGRQILERSGWLDNLQRGDIVAVKTHMGEAYNVGYLRPVIISTLVDLLKERGLRPFVTDTTTMPYHPWISRTLAMGSPGDGKQNGFNQGSVGCPNRHSGRLDRDR